MADTSSADLPLRATLVELLGHSQDGSSPKSTARVPVSDFATQLSVSGAIGDAIEDLHNLSGSVLSLTGRVDANTANVAKNTTDIAANTAAIAAGLKPDSALVRVLVTTATAPSAMTAGASLDGVTLAAGDRVARAYNGDAGDPLNGVYTVQASGAAIRSTDLDTSDELVRARFSLAGGSHSGEAWTIQNTATVTLGTTPIVIKQTLTSSPNTAELIASRQGEVDVPTNLTKIKVVQAPLIERDSIAYAIAASGSLVSSATNCYFDPATLDTLDNWVGSLTVATSKAKSVVVVVAKVETGGGLTFVSATSFRTLASGITTFADLDIFVPAGCVVGLYFADGVYFVDGGAAAGYTFWFTVGLPGTNTANTSRIRF